MLAVALLLAVPPIPTTNEVLTKLHNTYPQCTETTYACGSTMGAGYALRNELRDVFDLRSMRDVHRLQRRLNRFLDAEARDRQATKPHE